MIEKWICTKCFIELYNKPNKNQLCLCGGRFRHYSRCECGTFFYNPNNDKRYCSNDCVCKNKKIELICDNCGIIFKRLKSNIKNSKKHYCSKKCFDEYINSKIIKNCLWCGKEFKINKSVLSGKTNSSGKFCSPKCYYESMTFLDKPHRYGKEFSINKKKFFKNSFCVLCGSFKNIHIHHIIPFRLTKDNSVENLVALCSRHHKMFENATKNIVNNTPDYELTRIILKNILNTHSDVNRYLIEKYKRR